MKNLGMKKILAVAVCMAALASFSSCGDRNSSESSSPSSGTTSGTSASDSQNPDSGSSDSDSSEAATPGGQCNVIWIPVQDQLGDFTLFTATFKIADSAASGDYAITIADDASVSDSAFADVPLELLGGTIKVGSTDSESFAAPGSDDSTAVVLSTIGGSAGSEVTVTAKLLNSESCSSFDFSLLYDSSVLEVVTVQASQETSAGTFMFHVV